ncbi:MAG: M23 family metallopeptidase [Clostridia bacterium]|nr:M23 family metallopeptidase [Clostridia bacterium]
MNRRDETKLEVLSNIDDDIIEKQSIKRFELMTGIKKAPGVFGFVWKIAACIVLVFSLVIGVMTIINAQQIPVYEGMSISNTSPLTQTAKGMVPHGSIKTETLSATVGVPSFARSSLTDKVLKDHPAATGTNRSLYYANPNEDIYVSVHIDNPRQFEILSFTLNGVKYQSFMFEEGSDSETLVLKLNVGEIVGMTEYTIDAIKYVDGTEIKDVRMEGERTVRVGVCPEEQPTAEMTDVTQDLFGIGFTASVTDPLSLIADCAGTVYAIVYDGAQIVAEQSLRLESGTELHFDGLLSGYEYEVAVVAFYDALDGKGFTGHVLSKQSITTTPAATLKVDFSKVSMEKVIFSYTLESAHAWRIDRAELISADGAHTYVAEGTTAEILNVEPGTYQLYVHYSVGENRGVAVSEAVIVSYTFRISDVVRDAKLKKDCSGTTTQVWNETTQDYRYHLGIDLTSTSGQYDVFAAFSGTVERCWEDDEMGVCVTVRLPGGVTVSYKSLAFAEVEVGDTVKKGDLIGACGTCAIEASGRHVHFEMQRADDGHTDPLDLYLDPNDFILP